MEVRRVREFTINAREKMIWPKGRGVLKGKYFLSEAESTEMKHASSSN